MHFNIHCNSSLRTNVVNSESTFLNDQGIAVIEKGEDFECLQNNFTCFTQTTCVDSLFQPKKLGFSHFGNLRKKKFDESTDYICPMDTSPAATNGTSKNYSGYKGLSPFTDRELDQVGQTD